MIIKSFFFKRLVSALFFALLYKGAFCQTNSKEIYQMAYQYLQNYDSLQAAFQSILPHDEVQECISLKSLFFVCPRVTFLNVSGFKDVLSIYHGDLGIRDFELQDRTQFKEMYYFESFDDPDLEFFPKEDKRYCTFLSFSKLFGKVLPIHIFKNEMTGNENPCDDLLAPKLGNAIVFFLVLNSSLSAVDAAFYRVVQMN